MSYRDSPEPIADHYDASYSPRPSGTDNPFHDNHNIQLSPRGGIPAAAESATGLNTPYTDIPRRAHYGDRREAAQNDTWMEKPEKRGHKIRYLLILGLVVAILGGVGAALGVVLSKKSHNNSSSTNSGSSSSSSGNPSVFAKNPALKQSFYGIAYTPVGSQLPECGANLDAVIEDIQLLSQLTTRVRLYGADCNITALVLEAIKQTKVNMSVAIANYPLATDNGAAYENQSAIIQQALETYGTDNIINYAVGNEFILDYLDANDATSPNGAVGDQGATILNGYIKDARSLFANHSWNMPIGTAEAGAYFNNEVLEQCDFGMANVHPWFANVSVDQAAGWTWNFFETIDVNQSLALSNKPQMSIAETGWPTNATDAGSITNGPSLASEANLQIFLNDFLCQANANGTEYYFFEAFDEEWKLLEFGGVEGYWGLFYQNKTLKNIEIPDCSS